jgi:hypothetical protein
MWSKSGQFIILTGKNPMISTLNSPHTPHAPSAETYQQAEYTSPHTA